MKAYLLVASVVFLLVAVAHATRIACSSTLIIGSWNVPMWTSYVGVILVGGFSLQGFRFAKNAH